MKKLIAGILVLCLMLSVCACGKKNTDDTEAKEPETTAAVQGDTTEAPEETKKEASKGAVTLEDVMNHPVTPAEDFKYGQDDENGGIAILGYEGDDNIVVLPDTIDGKPVTLVESYVFGSASNVKGIRISDNVKRLNDLAFGLNKNLEVVVCGSGLKELGVSVFQECEKLHTVVLNEGLTTIDNLAFSGCFALKELEVPDSVTEAFNSPFFGLDESLVVIGKAGSEVEEAAIANGVTFKAK